MVCVLSMARLFACVVGEKREGKVKASGDGIDSYVSDFTNHLHNASVCRLDVVPSHMMQILYLSPRFLGVFFLIE